MSDMLSDRAKAALTHWPTDMGSAQVAACGGRATLSRTGKLALLASGTAIGAGAFGIVHYQDPGIIRFEAGMLFFAILCAVNAWHLK